jgi:hypothetical protein
MCQLASAQRRAFDPRRVPSLLFGREDRRPRRFVTIVITVTVVRQ